MHLQGNILQSSKQIKENQSLLQKFSGNIFGALHGKKTYDNLFGSTAYLNCCDRNSNLLVENKGINNILLLCGFSETDNNLISLLQSIILSYAQGIYSFHLSFCDTVGEKAVFKFDYCEQGLYYNSIINGFFIKNPGWKQSFESTIKNRLLGAKKLGLDKIYTFAERNDTLGIYGYNIWPKYGYDVHWQKRDEIIEYLKNIAHGLTQNIEKKYLVGFLDQYSYNKHTLLLPILFENALGREIWK